MVSVILLSECCCFSLFCPFLRQEKLSATSKVIEDIDQSQGLHHYYNKISPEEKGVNCDIIVKKFWK